MPTPTDNSNWFWSQQGVTLGPIDLEEIRRLASVGTIQPSTYVYDPVRAAWVLAGSVDGLFPAGPASPPPDAAGFAGSVAGPGSPSAGFAASGTRRTAPPPAMPAAPGASTLDPRSAAVVCRACVMVAPFVYVLAVVGPAVVWAMSPRDERVVAEAKSALNCLLVAFLGSIVAMGITIIGALVIIGPFIGVPMMLAIGAYLVVCGIRGLMAASDDRPFNYPWIPVLIR